MSTTTTNNSSLRTILDNPFISSPISFGVTKVANGEVLVSAVFMDSRKTMPKDSPVTKVSGTVVSDPNIIGSNAQVIPTKGIYNKQPTQRLLLSIASPTAPKMEKTIDFYAIPGSNAQAKGSNSGNLGMVICSGLLPPTHDSAQEGVPSIPLLVGPQSAVFGDIDQSTLNAIAEMGVGISGSKILDLAKTIVPVLAKSGYDIYKELSGQSELVSDDVEGFSDVLGSLADIASGIAGKAIGAAASSLFL